MTASPTEDDLVLDAMLATLDRFLLVMRSVTDECRGEFAAGSPARTDWESATRLQRDLHDAYHTALVQWHSIRDLARGVHTAIRDQLPHSAITLARSLAEGAARSWYLLEEGIEPLERVRRLLNDRLYANFENLRLFDDLLPRSNLRPELLAVARKVEPQTQAQIAKLHRERNQLFDSARTYGLAPIKGADKAKATPSVGGNRLSSQAVVGKALESENQGAAFHRFASAIAHSSLHGLNRMFVLREDDGRIVASMPPITADDVGATIWPGVGVMAVTALLLFRQAGWPTETLEATFRDLFQAWNQLPANLPEEFMDLI